MYKKYGKRLMDFILSLLALFFLFPVLMLVAVMIKADSRGPVLFTQERLGKGGRIFHIIKFRTMVVGAESMGTGLIIDSANDDRITKVGKFLRKTSLDELPQLINILKGDMSIVGPRPPATYYPYDGADNYPQWAQKRFEVRPGLTGFAQVICRNNAPWDDKIKIDNQYIHGLNFSTDIIIIFKTLIQVIKRDNIY